MFMRGRLMMAVLPALLALAMVLCSAAEAATMARKTEDGKWAFVPLADGFDFPVGKPDAEGYYKSRGLRLRTPRHMGEDWNGVGGGNSDLGDPVYTVGHGLVTYASDARGRWGKVVIVRHAFRDPGSGKVLCCQTLYAHLDRIDVQLGQLVRRGDQIGTIGTIGTTGLKRSTPTTSTASSSTISAIPRTSPSPTKGATANTAPDFPGASGARTI